MAAFTPQHFTPEQVRELRLLVADEMRLMFRSAVTAGIDAAKAKLLPALSDTSSGEECRFIIGIADIILLSMAENLNAQMSGRCAHALDQTEARIESLSKSPPTEPLK